MGRKPMAAKHVDHLEGSEHARQRLKLILQCMLGEKTIPEACEELGICESRFHAMRNQWMQEALELLEPRRTGRPPKRQGTESDERIGQLEREIEELQEQLRETIVRCEVTQIEATMPDPLKKMRLCKPR